MSRAVVPLPEERTESYVRKRATIVAAAARVFNQKGLKGATLADVAEIVGLSSNAITYYYRFKEELALDCYRRTLEVFETLVREARAEPDVPSRVRHFLNAWFGILAEIARGERDDLITFFDYSALSRQHFEELQPRFVQLSRDTRRIVLADDAGVDPRAQHALPYLLLSLAYGVRNWVTRYEPFDYPRAAARMADILLGGIFKERAGDLPRAMVVVEAKPEGRVHSRDSFLRAATELINRQGYRGVSVEKIAASLGVTKGSFYHHIDAKDDLVAGCFERSFEIVRDTLRRSGEGGRKAVERLRFAVTALVRYQISPEGPLLRYTAMSAMPEALRPSVRQAGDRLTESIAGIVSDAIADGDIRPIDAAIAAQLLDTTINAAVALIIWTRGLDHEQRLKAYLVPLLAGLAPER